MKTSSGRMRTESGRCPICKTAMLCVVLARAQQDRPALLIVPQHPKPTQENLVGCRGSGAVALDRFAP